MSNEIRKTIIIDVPPQVVFKALTDEKEPTDLVPEPSSPASARWRRDGIQVPEKRRHSRSQGS